MRTLVSYASSTTPRFSKVRRHYLEPIAIPKENPRFEKPPLTNNVNLILPLRIIIPKVNDLVEENKKLVFHALGDSGGIHGEDVQNAVAEAMESQFVKGDDENSPAFAYHLGDVIYFNGQSDFYPSQFYDPYKFYPGPIFAIPGNHDGDTATRPGDPQDSEATLYGFIQNFCAPYPQHIDAYRATMTQPYVYWTLNTPLLTIIGLYSNVEGTLDARGTFEQQKWLEDQLAAAPKDRFLAITVHHPPYSLDASHGGSPDIASALDNAIKYTKVVPHVVLSGHVHNYQRYTRVYDERQIPYIIDGRGGYANTLKSMHKLQKDENGNYPSNHTKTESREDPTLDLTLESYDQTNPGFLRVTVTDKGLTVDSYTVPFDGPFTNEAADSVTVSMDGKITSPPSGKSESQPSDQQQQASSHHGSSGHGKGKKP